MYIALMVELADTGALKAPARNRRPGSNPGGSIINLYIKDEQNVSIE